MGAISVKINTDVNIMNNTNVIDYLVERRKDLHLSQRELAKRCNMPQSTIARIEKHQI